MVLTGPLPASWARNGSFPSLQSVGLGADLAGPRLACMSGPMPAEWGSPSAFQLLEILTLRICFESKYPSQDCKYSYSCPATQPLAPRWHPTHLSI